MATRLSISQRGARSRSASAAVLLLWRHALTHRLLTRPALPSAAWFIEDLRQGTFFKDKHCKPWKAKWIMYPSCLLKHLSEHHIPGRHAVVAAWRRAPARGRFPRAQHAPRAAGHAKATVDTDNELVLDSYVGGPVLIFEAVHDTGKRGQRGQ